MIGLPTSDSKPDISLSGKGVERWVNISCMFVHVLAKSCGQTLQTMTSHRQRQLTIKNWSVKYFPV